jgi:hypothetical protein
LTGCVTRSPAKAPERDKGHRAEREHDLREDRQQRRDGRSFGHRRGGRAKGGVSAAFLVADCA